MEPTDDSLNDDELEELESILGEIEQHLGEGNLQAARASLAEAEELAGADDPDVGYARALIAAEAGELEAAAAELRRVLEADPDFADAHYALGLALEELGDEAGTVHHFLRTRALDAKSEKESGLGAKADIDAIERVARETLDALPEPFVGKLKNVPIVLETRPNRALVEEGFDPRALGLFEGPEHGRDDVPAPTRIVLFTSNLLASYEGDDLEEQVEITVLHEVGHYFGLDEDDMERLGLD